MPTVGSFVDALARRIRPDRAAAWDPVGLQLGDPSRELARVAVCHEVTEGIVDVVLGNPPDLLVTYHPLLFHPTSHLVAGPTPAGRAWRLASAGVGVLVTHTDFDSAPGGTSDALAEELGLVGATPFGPMAGRDQVKIVVFVPTEAVAAVTAAMAGAGAGRIGNYTSCYFRTDGTGSFLAGDGADPVVGGRGEMTSAPEARLEMIAERSAEEAVLSALVASHPYEEPAFDVYAVRSNHGFIGRVGVWNGILGGLADLVGQRLGRSQLRLAGDPGATVAKVAVVPGSGASFISAARRAGADALVTGDVDHHRAVGAVDAGLGVVDPGHAATEAPGMRRLVDIIGEMGVEVVDLTGDGSGPWVDLPENSLS